MGMTDPIADLLTRIRNALLAEHDKVIVPASKLKLGITDVLKREGYIKDYKFESDLPAPLRQAKRDSKQGIIRIYFKPVPVIQGLKRISKPGRRVYIGTKKIPRVQNGLGIAIISTPQGVFSDRECRKAKVGGEVLAYVW